VDAGHVGVQAAFTAPDDAYRNAVVGTLGARVARCGHAHGGRPDGGGFEKLTATGNMGHHGFSSYGHTSTETSAPDRASERRDYPNHTRLECGNQRFQGTLHPWSNSGVFSTRIWPRPICGLR
jgi:hypothetical protein